MYLGRWFLFAGNWIKPRPFLPLSLLWAAGPTLGRWCLPPPLSSSLPLLMWLLLWLLRYWLSNSRCWLGFCTGLLEIERKHEIGVTKVISLLIRPSLWIKLFLWDDIHFTIRVLETNTHNQTIPSNNGSLTLLRGGWSETSESKS